MIRALLLLCLTPGLAEAHPHMFLQTAVAVVFDGQGKASGVRISWIYDDFSSMQILADQGLAETADGTLAPADLAKLNGFDMTWKPGWKGDSFARLDQTELDLSGPQDWTVAYAGGQLTTTHLRRFAQPLDLRGHVLGVSTYDPTYYVQYEMSPAIVLENAPPGCRSIYRPADTAKAKADLEAQLRALQGDPELTFPAVGKSFASEAWILCASGS